MMRIIYIIFALTVANELDSHVTTDSPLFASASVS
jgi:hypothetical protein